jgi:sulfite reductase alpha subunit-like flavoprotein
MSNENKYIYILYGSQTGNSESIAQNLQAILVEDKNKVKCLTLNDSINLDFKDSIYLFIICSTTGNGEPPLNADKWWRHIKNRSINKNKFINIKYAVLGLGDTNYDKFCYMGKAIDKRIYELGGERILNIFCADEANDMDVIIEDWIENIKLLVNENTKNN